jgi:hypothetical protein
MGQHETQAQRATVTLLLTTIHVSGLLLVFLVGGAAYWTGMFHNFLFVLPMVSVPIVLLVRLWGLFRKQLAWSFIRRPLQRENSRYGLQGLLQWMFWLLLGFALYLAIVPVQLAAADLFQIRTVLWGSIGVLMILALVPSRKIRLSTNIFFSVASLFLVVELVRILWPTPVINAVVLAPPFRGEWYVLQGGRSALVNHHFPLKSQRHAIDIYIPRRIDRAKGTPLTLETHPAFGQTLYAPAAGRVAKVVNDRPDMETGKTDLEQIVGNHITIDIGKGRYVLMAHLMQNSILVKPGDEVWSGQAIARCGNSGNTTEPHLHLQVQSDADFGAEGLRTYPIRLRGVTRRRGGRSEYVNSADLRRNDVVIGEAGEESRNK